MANIVTSESINVWNRENEQADPIVALLAITSEELDSPLLISSDNTSFLRLDDESKEPVYGTIHEEQEYIYYPFKFILPDQVSSGIPSASITIDNVDSVLYATLRSLSTAPFLDIKVVRASDPDYVENSLPTLRAAKINATIFAISAELTPDSFLSCACPAQKFYLSSNPTLVA